jgi:phosphoribosylformylglycinamidine cyclo-ligase
MLSYKDAGVDIAAGEDMVERIKPLVRSTFTPGVLTDIGAFGAFFQPNFQAYQNPTLVSSVDGVGTKLKVAFMTNKHDSVGQCLVNHCVNDIAVCGAVPLFFMDYFATGKLAPDVAVEVVKGFTVACKENGCALIGGETAEMPDMYQVGEYDLAGTIVGIVDKNKILDGASIKANDVLIGLPSTGLHTNGYSLARKALFSKFGIDDCPPELGGKSIGEALLAVHRSYLAPIQALHTQGLAKGFSHITGGGIEGNTKRILHGERKIAVDWTAWERPAIFNLIQEIGQVAEEDMRQAFNLGIGLIAVVSSENVAKVVEIWQQMGENPVVMGKIQ